jgi:molybdopterin converting factor small subunit
MQDLTNQNSTVEVEASTLRQVVNALEEAYPGSKDYLLEDGQFKGNISVAVDGEVTTMGMLEKVGEKSEVHFLPAIAGG